MLILLKTVFCFFQLFSMAEQVTLVFVVAQTVKNLPTVQETWVQSQGQEDTLEKGMATHSSTLAWKIPWTKEPGRLQAKGLLRVDMTERLHFHFSLSCIGEGNGNPLQCSCLESPRDRGAWWAAVYRVTQSRTRPTQLSSSSIQYSHLRIPWRGSQAGLQAMGSQRISRD